MAQEKEKNWEDGEKGKCDGYCGNLKNKNGTCACYDKGYGEAYEKYAGDY